MAGPRCSVVVHGVSTSFYRVLFLLALAGITRAAEPPASLANLVYYETGRSTARTTYWIAFALEANGTARGLFFLSTGAGQPFPVFTSGTQTGTWRQLNATSGQVDLEIATPGGGGPVNDRRTLTFASANAGSASTENTINYFGRTFQLAPISAQPPLLNCSNRSFVPAGGKAFAGFVVSGTQPRAVLIRAIGPGLAPFGVSGALPDPQLTLNAGTQVFAQNDNWDPSTGSTSIVASSAFVGAFPLAAGSRDSALIAVLAPGNYVAEVSGKNATDSGEALVEIYMLP